jgi:putative endonuclease
MRSYYVYIMASSTCTLYVGVTNDLERRVFEHKQDLVPGFTRRYAVKRLVYYEDTNDVSVAIAREKQIKGWRRSRKVELIASMNPAWRDLSDGWYGSGGVALSAVLSS